MEHHHTHSHNAQIPETKEEILALLSYMLEHNRHHAAEIHELGHHVSADSAALIHQAVDYYEQGNEKLEEAVRLLKENC